MNKNGNNSPNIPTDSVSATHLPTEAQNNVKVSATPSDSALHVKAYTERNGSNTKRSKSGKERDVLTSRVSLKNFKMKKKIK